MPPDKTVKSSGADAVRIARLVRFARDQHLSEDVRALLRERLLEALTPEARAAIPSSSAQAARAESTLDRPKKVAARGAVSSRRMSLDASQLDLMIRQLVDADAPFLDIEPLAWELYEKRPSAEMAARIVELAFLHGSGEDLGSTLVRLKKSGVAFYSHVHASVRAHMVVKLWRAAQSEILSAIIFKDRDEAYLQPIERLFLFQSIASANDAATPYIYFRKYRRELFDASRELGAHVGLAPGRFLLTVGKMAIELGHDADARELLDQIHGNDPERDEALRLMLEQTVERNKSGRSHYLEMLFATADPLERVRLIGKFLGATRGLGGFRDRSRPALNEILEAPLDQLGESPEAWATLSELLTSSRDLEPLLPNLFEVFRQNAIKFHSPLLDSSLWQGPLSLNPETPRDRYWHGVALLHHYVNCGASNERALWRARSLVDRARRDGDKPQAFTWKDLHKAAHGWIVKNHYLMEADRTRMLEQLRVALEPEQVVTSDVEAYLEHALEPPFEVLEALQSLTAAKKSPALECRVVLKRAEVSHLTNADLNRLWHLAHERHDNDLAWRVASVVHARGCLVAQVRHAWEISGEKRAHYQLVAPAKQAVERCVKGLSPRAARLAFASLHVGPLLPELLAMLDPGASVARIASAPSGSVEANVDRMLTGLSWLDAPRKRYRFSFEPTVGGTPVPQFMQVLPANTWSVLVARLAEHLGTNSWGFKLSRLNAQIVDLIPRLASRQDLRRKSGKVSSWLKKLAPEQRAAWQDLATLSRSIEDDRASDALAMFICRVATVMYQNHHMALTSLHAMRATAAVVWDLEAWIVSDQYSELRQKLGTFNRVIVPNALQRLTSIVAP